MPDAARAPSGLALTPPMGFANWNGFGCNYNDTTFRQQADFLVSSGMAAAVQRACPPLPRCASGAPGRQPAAASLLGRSPLPTRALLLLLARVNCS